MFCPTFSLFLYKHSFSFICLVKDRNPIHAFALSKSPAKKEKVKKEKEKGEDPQSDKKREKENPIWKDFEDASSQMLERSTDTPLGAANTICPSAHMTPSSHHSFGHIVLMIVEKESVMLMPNRHPRSPNIHTPVDAATGRQREVHAAGPMVLPIVVIVVLLVVVVRVAQPREVVGQARVRAGDVVVLRWGCDQGGRRLLLFERRRVEGRCAEEVHGSVGLLASAVEVSGLRSCEGWGHRCLCGRCRPFCLAAVRTR